MERQIDRFAPDCLHIATEGPLGWLARSIALRTNWPFRRPITAVSPSMLKARFRVPIAGHTRCYQRFHNTAQATTAPTPAIVADLKALQLSRRKQWRSGASIFRYLIIQAIDRNHRQRTRSFLCRPYRSRKTG